MPLTYRLVDDWRSHSVNVMGQKDGLAKLTDDLLSTDDDPSKTDDHNSNAPFIFAVLRDLVQLSLQANDMFGGLYDEAESVGRRVERAVISLDKLGQRADRLVLKKHRKGDTLSINAYLSINRHYNSVASPLERQFFTSVSRPPGLVAYRRKCSSVGVVRYRSDSSDSSSGICSWRDSACQTDLMNNYLKSVASDSAASNDTGIGGDISKTHKHSHSMKQVVSDWLVNHSSINEDQGQHQHQQHTPATSTAIGDNHYDSVTTKVPTIKSEMLIIRPTNKLPCECVKIIPVQNNKKQSKSLAAKRSRRQTVAIGVILDRKSTTALTRSHTTDCKTDDEGGGPVYDEPPFSRKLSEEIIWNRTDFANDCRSVRRRQLNHSCELAVIPKKSSFNPFASLRRTVGSKQRTKTEGGDNTRFGPNLPPSTVMTSSSCSDQSPVSTPDRNREFADESTGSSIKQFFRRSLSLRIPKKDKQRLSEPIYDVPPSRSGVIYEELSYTPPARAKLPPLPIRTETEAPFCRSSSMRVPNDKSLKFCQNANSFAQRGTRTTKPGSLPISTRSQVLQVAIQKRHYPSPNLERIRKQMEVKRLTNQGHYSNSNSPSLSTDPTQINGGRITAASSIESLDVLKSHNIDTASYRRGFQLDYSGLDEISPQSGHSVKPVVKIANGTLLSHCGSDNTSIEESASVQNGFTPKTFPRSVSCHATYGSRKVASQKPNVPPPSPPISISSSGKQIARVSAIQKSEISQNGLLDYESLDHLSPLPGRRLRHEGSPFGFSETSNDDSIYSCDQDGYYTSMHCDSGVPLKLSNGNSPNNSRLKPLKLSQPDYASLSKKYLTNVVTVTRIDASTDLARGRSFSTHSSCSTVAGTPSDHSDIPEPLDDVQCVRALGSQSTISNHSFKSMDGKCMTEDKLRVSYPPALVTVTVSDTDSDTCHGTSSLSPLSDQSVFDEDTKNDPEYGVIRKNPDCSLKSNRKTFLVGDDALLDENQIDDWLMEKFAKEQRHKTITDSSDLAVQSPNCALEARKTGSPSSNGSRKTVRFVE